MTPSPAVTVLVTVYNGSRYVAESVGSVLAQTMPNFELLIIDDASTDHSLKIVREFEDPRIRLLVHEKNRGIHDTLNHGMAEAKAPLMAIMDQDDIAQPTRLERQLEHFSNNPNMLVCGTAIETFGDNPGPSWVRFHDPENVKIALLFENPLCHPSVMMNREALLKLGLSYPPVPLAEEYALWVRASREGMVANLDQPLLRYRAHAQQVSRSRNLLQNRSNDQILREQLHHLGVSFSARELIIHKMLTEGFNPLPGAARHLRRWILRLQKANDTKRIYDAGKFADQLEHRRRATLKRLQDRLGSMSLPRKIRWQVAVTVDYLRASSNPAH